MFSGHLWLTSDTAKLRNVLEVATKADVGAATVAHLY